MPQGWKINGLSLASRATFAAVLVPWFLIGGLSKIVWLPGSVADLTSGLPDIALMGQIYVAGMLVQELALPMMIVIGFYARAAALLLMGHQLVFWIGSQPPEQYGAICDASPFDMVPDQLLLWALLLAPVALFGAGPVSLDAACPDQVFLGEQAEVRITTAILTDSLLVPEVAIQGFDGHRGDVWTLQEWRLAQIPLILGHRTEDTRVEVVSGLPDGAPISWSISHSRNLELPTRPRGRSCPTNCFAIAVLINLQRI